MRELSEIEMVLFEENPYWFTIAGEIVLAREKYNCTKINFFQKVLSYPLSRNRNWSRLSKYPSHLILFYLELRILWWKLYSNASPMRKLIKYLKNRNGNLGIFIHSQNCCKLNKKARNINTLKDEKLLIIARDAIKEDYGITKNMSEIRQSKVKVLSKNLRKVQDHLVNFLESSKSDTYYFMNGRTCYERLFSELLKFNNLTGLAVEAEWSNERLIFNEENWINYPKICEKVENFWEKSVEEYGESWCLEIASKYFKLRRSDVNFNLFAGTFNSKLPNNNTLHICDQKFNVAFFSSSTDEIASVYSFLEQDMPNQETVVNSLIENFENLGNDFHLYIRLHPNLKNKSKSEKHFWNQLKSKGNVTIFDSNCRVDSYELASKMDMVLTMSSFLGVEAAFMRIKSFAFCMSPWSMLGASIHLDNESADISYLQNFSLNLELMHRQAIKYGFFVSHFGEKFEFFDLRKCESLDKKISLKRWF